jgi:alkylresorcinol/alkylpyrone synthase
MRASLVALATAVPPYTVAQEDARTLARGLFREVLCENQDRLLGVFDNSGIQRRSVSAPLEWYAEDHDFAEKNALYVETAVRLGTELAERTMVQAGLTVRDIDHLVFVSSTGLAAPSIDARIANQLGLRGDFRRTPIWGLGCAGGAAGLARARDYALAEPGARVLLIALELCTLTFQRNDLSKRNLVATSLFADGAAAALVVAGDTRPAGDGPRIELLGSASTFWEDTLDVMGWEVDGAGLHVVFAHDIPTIVRERVRPSVEEFLARHGLSLIAMSHLVAHPGGAKVIAAYQQALDLPPERLDHARAVLRDHGNMSSPTCLFVLQRFLRARDIGPGQHAVLSALGPGFCAEYVLLRGSDA